MKTLTWTTTGTANVLAELLRLEIKRNTMIYFYCGKCDLRYVRGTMDTSEKLLREIVTNEKELMQKCTVGSPGTTISINQSKVLYEAYPYGSSKLPKAVLKTNK